MSDNTILKVENLHKNYNSANPRNAVIDNLSIDIDKNEFVCILGPSGCGKSTFLRCIAGFEDFEGAITSNGKEVTAPGKDRIMVFQDFNQLYPWKTIEKNVQYPLKVQGLKDKAKLKEISDSFLKKVDLDGYQKMYPHELSGGMKQRVAIAKALALKPDIILMDEPFAALDAMTRNNLHKELFKIYKEENITVIFVTHNIQEAIVLGSRILLMSKQGEIVIDRQNTMEKPCSPASEGCAELWDMFSKALENENTRVVDEDE